MDVFAQYATSLDAEENGRPHENGDATFIIARSGNVRYSAQIAALYSAHKHTLDERGSPEAIKLSDARADKINIDVMSKTILLGWEGNVTYKGEKLEHSVANAAKLLAHKDFRAWVNGKSDNYKNFLEQVKKEDEKNLETTSSGN